jgi:RimJ/RimL family protein N-acetyltransferase
MAAQAIFPEDADIEPATPSAVDAMSPVRGVPAAAPDAVPLADLAAETTISFDRLDWPLPTRSTPSPLVCAAWADAIASYWLHQLDNDALDLEQPLYLLDLASGDGALACYLLDALAPWLASPDRKWPPLRYLLCGGTQAECDALLTHPSLARHAADGLLAAALRPECGQPLPNSGNPLVIVAWEYFSMLPQQLHGVHYGTTMTAEVTWEHAPRTPGALGYEWTNRQLPPSRADGLIDALLNHYAQRCNSNSLLLPMAACAAIERVVQMSDGRYLMLAADHGVGTERQLRLNAGAPPAAWPAPAPLPLNIHALSLVQQSHGATTWLHQLSDGGHVLHAAWSDGNTAIATTAATAFATIRQALLRAHPDDSADMASLAASWTGEQSLTLAPSLLRQCGYDPAILRACLPALLSTAADHGALPAWHESLEQVWNRYIPALRYDGFYRQIGVLAARMGHFGLARACLSAGLGWYGDDVGDLYQLAHCEIATGRSAIAADLLAQALTLDPSDTACLALQAELAGRDTLLPAATHDDSGLTLEHLHEGHAAALRHQYRDPQIAVMTCLPQLETHQQALDWIARQREDSAKICCAVMDPCWGLVGMVCMHCAGDAGYFYFWTGCDFQGRGYGRAGAALMWQVAAQRGIGTVYTSVFTDNARSRRALDAAGFTPLGIRALAPDQDLLFLGRSLDDRPATSRQLRQLCAAIDSPLQFQPEQEAA